MLKQEFVMSNCSLRHVELRALRTHYDGWVGSSEHVFQEFEAPQTSFDLPSFLPRQKSYNADANNARLDHMVPMLDAKIERTHEMLLQLKGDSTRDVGVIMKS